MSTSNVTCFFLCFSSVGVGASCFCTLLWDSWDLCCRSRSSRGQLNQSLAGWDCGGLGEGDWCLLGHWGEGLWQCLDLSLLWEGHLLDPTGPVEWSSLSHLTDSAPKAQLRGNQPMRWNGCGSISCLLQ